MFTPCVFGAVSDVTITPSSPKVGDTVKIIVQADPSEQVSMDIDYSGDAPVSSGKYKIELDNIVVPGTPNSVSAKASGVENLRIAVKLPIVGWVTLNKDASGGSASLSQGNIPAGSYDVEIKGDALPGENEVSLTFSADVTLTTDSSGKYTYSYKTSGIPPGTIKVDVEGVKKTITLSSASSGGSSGGVTVPLNPKADFSVTGDLVVGGVLSFDGGESEPTYGSVTKYAWRFGDGNTGSGETVSHVYDAPGEYSVKLTVTNSAGLTDDKTTKLTISEIPNLSPVSNPGSNRGCFTGQLVDFKSKSSDPDGSIVSYLWDFDDGTVDTGRGVQHSWITPGLYYVNHTVVDDRGAKATAYLTVSVEALAVEISNFKNITLEGEFFQYFGDLGASISASGNGTRFYLFGYTENPHPEAVLPMSQTGGIVDLVVSNPDEVDWPVYFEMRYSEEDVPDVVESSLGLYFYSSGVWARCSQTGVDLLSGVVWANLTQAELTGSPLTVGVVTPLPFFEYSGLSLTSYEVEEGELAVAMYTLRNTGDKAGNVVTLLYLDGEAVASKTLHLDSGEESQQLMSFTVHNRGEYNVQVDELVVEVLVVPPTVPDLVAELSSGQVAVEVGESVVLEYGVSNVGNRTAEVVSCSLKINELTVSSTRVEVVYPGETVQFEYIFTPISSDVNNVRYMVNFDEAIFEVNVENNVASIEIEAVTPINYGLITASLSILVVVGYILYVKGIIKLPF